MLRHMRKHYAHLEMVDRWLTKDNSMVIAARVHRFQKLKTRRTSRADMDDIRNIQMRLLSRFDGRRPTIPAAQGSNTVRAGFRGQLVYRMSSKLVCFKIKRTGTVLECLPSMCEVLSSACSTEERKVRKKGRMGRKNRWGGAGREGDRDREQEKGGKSRDEHCTVGRGVWNGWCPLEIRHCKGKFHGR